MEKRNLACGAWKLIEQGIERFISERGRRPASLILHPAHIELLNSEIIPEMPLLDGVNLFVSSLVSFPTLMDGAGDYFEL